MNVAFFNEQFAEPHKLLRTVSTDLLSFLDDGSFGSEDEDRTGGSELELAVAAPGSEEGGDGDSGDGAGSEAEEVSSGGRPLLVRWPAIADLDAVCPRCLPRRAGDASGRAAFAYAEAEDDAPGGGRGLGHGPDPRGAAAPADFDPVQRGRGLGHGRPGGRRSAPASRVYEALKGWGASTSMAGRLRGKVPGRKTSKVQPIIG